MLNRRVKLRIPTYSVGLGEISRWLVKPGLAPANEAAIRTDGTIDYAAVTCEARPFPVLGFTQRGEGESGYPLRCSMEPE